MSVKAGSWLHKEWPCAVAWVRAAVSNACIAYSGSSALEICDIRVLSGTAIYALSYSVQRLETVRNSAYRNSASASECSTKRAHHRSKNYLVPRPLPDFWSRWEVMRNEWVSVSFLQVYTQRLLLFAFSLYNMCPVSHSTIFLLFLSALLSLHGQGIRVCSSQQSHISMRVWYVMGVP